MSGDRRLRLGRGRAVAFVVLLGGALFALTLPVWARGDAATPVGSEAVAVSGSVAVPGVASAALVVLVSGLVLALSGRLTRALAVLGVIGGGGLGAVAAADFLGDPEPALLRAAGDATGVAQLTGDAVVTAFPTIALVLAVLIGIVGVALPFLMGRWQRVGRRYEVAGEPAADTAAPSGRTRAIDDWDALSRGDDPSAAGAGADETRA